MRIKRLNSDVPLRRGELGSPLILLNVGQKNKKNLKKIFVKENWVVVCFSCSFKKKKIGWLFDFPVLLGKKNETTTWFSLGKKIKQLVDFLQHSIPKFWKVIFHYVIFVFFIIFSNIVDHKMNIWFCLIFLI